MELSSLLAVELLVGTRGALPFHSDQRRRRSFAGEGAGRGFLRMYWRAPRAEAAAGAERRGLTRQKHKKKLSQIMYPRHQRLQVLVSHYRADEC